MPPTLEAESVRGAPPAVAAILAARNHWAVLGLTRSTAETAAIR